jgi:hypothetical protein
MLTGKGGFFLAATLLLAGGAQAAEGPPDGSTPEQKAIIKDDPAFRPLSLSLKPLKPAEKATALFNGRDLSGWDSWLGYADAITTYGMPKGEPIGLNKDRDGVFRVVQEDGAPAIYSSGKIFGGLITKKSYRNYHLRVDYKWGPNSWLPMPRNNGVLYHSFGRYGAFFGTWMSAVEFEIVPHSVGMLLTVGDSKGSHSFSTVDWIVSADAEVGHDAKLPYPGRRFMPGGREATIRYPAYNVEAGTDAEKPIGQWNRLDLYVFGDSAIHVVNGVPVMRVSNIRYRDANGTEHPLTGGRIQLQSEGAETYFRNVSIEPIAKLPEIVDK